MTATTLLPTGFVLPILLLCLLTVFVLLRTEGFQSIGTRFQCPTRNMSYDLRGDVLMNRTFDIHLQNPTIGPAVPQSCNYRKNLFVQTAST